MNVRQLNEEITNHLEFLGYDIDDLKADTGHTYIAKSDKKSNIMVRVYNNTTILAARWSGFQSKALKSKDFFETINEINQNMMSKWYYEVSKEDGDITIVIEADYYDYNKPTFGTFVENFESEIQAGLQKFNTFM